FQRSAADEAAVAALPSLRDVPMHRPLIRLPPVVSKVAFGVLVGALVFFFVAPIAWMVIASLQTDDALSHMPPQLSLSLWTDGYVRLAQARNWQGSFAVSLMNAIGTTFFVI